MPSEPYVNSRPFDVHRWSEYPQLLQATKTLWEILYPHKQLSWDNKRVRHLRVVLNDLYACYLEDPTKWVGFSRDRNHYKKSRYNALHISYRPLIDGIIDPLISSGYIEQYPGCYNRETMTGYTSRMKATTKLIDLIEMSTEDNQRKAIPINALGFHPDQEVLILRDVHGRDTEYEDTDNPNITRWREELRKYNELLWNTEIILDPYEVFEPNVDYTRKKIHRVFNTGSFLFGGRFYGGWWTSVNNRDLSLRKYILIAGEKTVELDYKAMHISILYAGYGIDCFSIFDDPYIVESIPHCHMYRKFFKLLLLIIINASDRTSAAAAVRQKIKEERDKGNIIIEPEGMSINDAIRLFEDKHRTISEFFYSSWFGIFLQRIDALVAEGIINHFTDLNIPVLCVHDSFIIQERHKESLEAVMSAEFLKHTKGIVPRISQSS